MLAEFPVWVNPSSLFKVVLKLSIKHTPVLDIDFVAGAEPGPMLSLFPIASFSAYLKRMFGLC